MLADCGGAQRIATLIDNSVKHIQWAVVLTGFTVGFALFYEVRFRADAAAGLYHRRFRAYPAAALAYRWPRRSPSPTVSCRHTRARPLSRQFSTPIWQNAALRDNSGYPDGYFAIRLFSPCLFRKVLISWKACTRKPSLKKRCRALASASGPLCGTGDLMAMRAVAEMVRRRATPARCRVLRRPGDGDLIAVLIALFTSASIVLSMEQINDTLTSSIKIIAHDAVDHRRRSAFKQVLVDSGMDKYIASIMHEPICHRCLWRGLSLRCCVLRWPSYRCRYHCRWCHRAADCHRR